MGRPGPKLSALTLFSNSHQPWSLLIAVMLSVSIAQRIFTSFKIHVIYALHDPLSRSSVCDSDTDTCERASHLRPLKLKSQN